MDKKYFNLKLLSCTIALTFALSLGSASSISSVEAQAFNNRSTQTVKEIYAKHGKLKAVLDKLVQEQKLTQTRADEILKLAEMKKQEMKKDCNDHNGEKHIHKKKNVVWALYKSGDITKEEAMAIKSKFQELRDNKFNEKLDLLQQKGILSSNDIIKINSFMKAEREAKREAIEKIKAMTEEERKQYFKAHKQSKKDILDKMVDEKVITESQAKEIKNVMPEFGKRKNIKD